MFCQRPPSTRMILILLLTGFALQMASIREQLRQLEEVNDDMLDEDAKYI